VGSLNDILDTERHTVDGRPRPGLAPTFGGFVGGYTRALKIEMYECTNPWLECGEIGKTALEKIARCIGAIGKARRGVEVRLWHESELFFRRQHDDALRYMRPLPLARVITNGLHRAGVALRFGPPYSITTGPKGSVRCFVPLRITFGTALNG